MTKPLESTPPVGKSPPAAAPVHFSSPAGRKVHVVPSVRAVPTKVMAVGMLEVMVAGMRARPGGGGGGAWQVVTVPWTPAVRGVAQEQTVP